NLAEVVLVVCNNKGAGVIERAHRIGIPLIMINREDFYETDHLSKELLTSGIDLIVLAGFLWLVPEHLIRTFPKKIINIHPALLPSFGGKGMYGMFVHDAVIRSGVKETGITIH
ncbi:formyltransferase family protein, partial [Arthrospira platensis SPKY1]|nr:formyltransferase family protein [Arthrospira platensis SPKY1]